MLTVGINYNLLPDRLVTIKLPGTVRLGRHELLIVVEENDAEKNVKNSNAKN